MTANFQNKKRDRFVGTWGEERTLPIRQDGRREKNGSWGQYSHTDCFIIFKEEKGTEPVKFHQEKEKSTTHVALCLKPTGNSFKTGIWLKHILKAIWTFSHVQSNWYYIFKTIWHCMFKATDITCIKTSLAVQPNHTLKIFWLWSFRPNQIRNT